MKLAWLIPPVGIIGVGAIAVAQTGSLASPPAPSAPTPTNEQERLATFTSEGQEVHMLVHLGRPVSDGAVDALLSQAGAKPYRVFMSIGGMAGTHSAPPERAGPSVIKEARDVSVAQVRSVLRGFETGLNRLVDSGRIDQADDKRVGQLRDSLEREERDKQMLAGFTGGRPIIYAVQVIAPESALASLRRSPQVTKVVVAYRIPDGRIVVPTPDLPADHVQGRRPVSHSSKSRDEVIGIARQRRAAR